MKITTLDIVPHMWYCLFLAIFGILSIFIPYADGLCRRNPWDWEKENPWKINNEIEKDCDEMKSFRRSPFCVGIVSIFD